MACPGDDFPGPLAQGRQPQGQYGDTLLQLWMESAGVDPGGERRFGREDQTQTLRPLHASGFGMYEFAGVQEMQEDRLSIDGQSIHGRNEQRAGAGTQQVACEAQRRIDVVGVHQWIVIPILVVGFLLLFRFFEKKGL